MVGSAAPSSFCICTLLLEDLRYPFGKRSTHCRCTCLVDGHLQAVIQFTRRTMQVRSSSPLNIAIDNRNYNNCCTCLCLLSSAGACDHFGSLARTQHDAVWMSTMQLFTRSCLHQLHSGWVTHTDSFCIVLMLVTMACVAHDRSQSALHSFPHSLHVQVFVLHRATLNHVSLWLGRLFYTIFWLGARCRGNITFWLVCPANQARRWQRARACWACCSHVESW